MPDKTILRKAKAEFAQYKPMLEVLNGGKASQTSGTSLFAAVQKKEKKDKAAVKAPAGKVYEWLCNEKNAIRGFLQIMSWGGIFYSAVRSDKIARCAVDQQCGSIDAQQFHDAMVARLCGDGPAEDDDNTNAVAKVSAVLLAK